MLRQNTARRVCACFLLLFLALSGPLLAEVKTSALMTPELLEKVRKENSECFACHSAEGLKTLPQDRLANSDIAKLRSLLHVPNVFFGSNHGLMECKQYHGQGYLDFPHAADAKNNLSPCEECHAVKVLRIEQQFDKSVHAANLKDQFTCSTCHKPHVDLIASKLVDPRKIVGQDNRHCLACHDSDLEFAKFSPLDKKTNHKKSRPDIDSVHEWLPNTRLHWKAVRCVECHTPPGKFLSHEILDKTRAEKKCVACHSVENSLKSRLYRHLVSEEVERLGFANSVILANTYVLGATRNHLIDSLLMIAFAAMLIGLLAHGIGRIVARILKRRKNNG